MFDIFVAELECPRCRHVGKIEMQTKARPVMNHEELRVGDPFPIEHESLISGGYLSVWPPRTGEPVRMLQIWICPSCGYDRNWALIVIEQGRIAKIEPIVVDRKKIDAVHYAETWIRRELMTDDEEDYELLVRLRGP